MPLFRQVVNFFRQRSAHRVGKRPAVEDSCFHAVLAHTEECLSVRVGAGEAAVYRMPFQAALFPFFDAVGDDAFEDFSFCVFESEGLLSLFVSLLLFDSESFESFPLFLASALE